MDIDKQYSMIRINKIFSKDGKVLSEAEKMVKPSKKIDKVKVETKASIKKIETKVSPKKTEAKIVSK